MRRAHSNGNEGEEETALRLAQLPARSSPRLLAAGSPPATPASASSAGSGSSLAAAGSSASPASGAGSSASDMDTSTHNTPIAPGGAPGQAVAGFSLPSQAAFTPGLPSAKQHRGAGAGAGSSSAPTSLGGAASPLAPRRTRSGLGAAAAAAGAGSGSGSGSGAGSCSGSGLETKGEQPYNPFKAESVPEIDPERGSHLLAVLFVPCLLDTTDFLDFAARLKRKPKGQAPSRSQPPSAKRRKQDPAILLSQKYLHGYIDFSDVLVDGFFDAGYECC